MARSRSITILLRAEPEERRAIQEELEGEFGSFADRLRAALEYLGPPDRLDAYPREGVAGGRWVNRPILFRSERSSYTDHLRRELEALVRYDRLIEALPSTALGVLLGIETPRSGALTRAPALPLVPVLPLNRDPEAAAREAMTAPLTVVTGQPGTGKSQIVVDLLAAAAVAGRPVLFASKNNKAVDVVRERLGALLGEERDFTLRLGNRERTDECRRELESRLAAAARLEVPLPPPEEFVRALEMDIAAVRREIAALDEAQERLTALDRHRRELESVVRPRWVEGWPGGDAPERDEIEPDAADALVGLLERLAGRARAGLWLTLLRLLAPGRLFRGICGRMTSLVSACPEAVRKDVDAVTAAAPRNAARLGEEAVAIARAAAWRSAEARFGTAVRDLEGGSEAPVRRIPKEVPSMEGMPYPSSAPKVDV